MEAFTISRLITSRQRNPNVPEVSRTVYVPGASEENRAEKLILTSNDYCSFCSPENYISTLLIVDSSHALFESV